MHDYQDMVFSTAVRLLGNEAQAQDIAQDTFLKAYEHFEQLRASPTRGGWLKTVVTNLCLNHVSRYRKRWRLFSELRASDDEQDSPALEVAVPDDVLDGLEAEERHVRVEQALGNLPEHQRVPLVLYHFEDLSYAEIAERLHVSLGKVKTDILRGRISMAAYLMRGAPDAADDDRIQP
jgi:RNA polymerase sigma-70 factor (ECF subfamily)